VGCAITEGGPTNLKKLHLEDKRGVGGDYASSTCSSITIIATNRKHALFSLEHGGYANIPPLNHLPLPNVKHKGAASFAGGIKVLARLQFSHIVRLYVGARRRTASPSASNNNLLAEFSSHYLNCFENLPVAKERRCRLCRHFLVYDYSQRLSQNFRWPGRRIPIFRRCGAASPRQLPLQPLSQCGAVPGLAMSSLRSPCQLSRQAYTTQSPAASNFPQAGPPAFASALSPSATGRGLNTHAQVQRVAEGSAVLPFAPSPALVSSRQWNDASRK
jgi:hypothetical protein